MKNSILILAGLMIIGGARASIIIPEPGKAISATTTLPSVNPSLLKECANATEEYKANCVVYTTTGVALSVSSVVLLKEEAKHVGPDVYAYLAGEEMTLALGEVLEKVRSESEELAQLSDKELSAALIQSLSL
ncbi:hypothetical protein ACJVC5_18290 [Peredibacter sp. HCB2-198]|uniref:hypothetical protein n=1 Tax=Peredibacter sp. HCB2-198 TaxID=3383025 RepID=UPI0038B4ABF3